ncbi:hypothetical protein PR202_ga16077 [Eleusine coracana subsp. coracana]|uniref:Sulfite exporter TauE/SafE family protein n=1 Tax=Eleusine coracana subsp. coracana TaxID=191504 RepID=A0AAV5CMA7_ELECO|nr:hypothetical protein PR202_ga16077 [Eleusine coracana subsp. coracana]
MVVAADGASPTGTARNLTQTDDGNSYHHIWPPMEFGWRIVLGSLIGFIGAVFGSIGGVGGGGIFVPMLALIIGFYPKSAAAMSKCMIMGTAVSTVCYNLKMKHPALDMPLIDHDLALLIQPMLASQEPEHATTVPTGPDDATDARKLSDEPTSFLKNVYWKEFGLLSFVWMAFLALQITKNYTVHRRHHRPELCEEVD